MNKDAAITLNRLSFSINNQTILQPISGSFYKGKITTLVGPSGAGKTTLLKLCNGLLPPTEGTITINNQPIEQYDPTLLRKNVGIVLQSAPIIRTSVYENLALPRKLHKEPFSKDEAIRFLEDVGLDESFLFRQATELSGGQKQKLAIARTLINNPEILLLDEITSALDPVSVHDIEELILKINKQYGSTIIWITHNLEQAKQLSDFTWVLIGGQLIENGAYSILEKSANQTVQQFLNGGVV